LRVTAQRRTEGRVTHFARTGNKRRGHHAVRVFAARDTAWSLVAVRHVDPQVRTRDSGGFSYASHMGRADSAALGSCCAPVSWDRGFAGEQRREANSQHVLKMAHRGRKETEQRGIVQLRQKPDAHQRPVTPSARQGWRSTAVGHLTRTGPLPDQRHEACTRCLYSSTCFAKAGVSVLREGWMGGRAPTGGPTPTKATAVARLRPLGVWRTAMLRLSTLEVTVRLPHGRISLRAAPC